MGDRGDARDSGLAVLLVPCTSNAQCSTGEECEVEHGVGACKVHDDAPADRGDEDAGLDHDQCEHGQGTQLCPVQPADDDHGRDGDAGSAAPIGNLGACTSDADCASGEECKHEDEHGSGGGTGTCTLHDGDHGGAGHGSDGHG
jgi:hypothetical protein